jgi:hypothetical protein
MTQKRRIGVCCVHLRRTKPLHNIGPLEAGTARTLARFAVFADRGVDSGSIDSCNDLIDSIVFEYVCG